MGAASGTPASTCNCCWTSGSVSAASTAREMACVSGAGADAGMNRPAHESTVVKRGMLRDSAKLGTAGNTGERVLPVTTSALGLPVATRRAMSPLAGKSTRSI